jgi:catechol 2,3-dioxygenase-like lactoylglutathione lyase family enzyme
MVTPSTSSSSNRIIIIKADPTQAHPAIHHTSIVTHNISASIEFYQIGIGLDLLSDVTVEMDWETLLGAKTNTLRAVSLGNSQIPDTTAGVVELNAFEGGVPIGPIDSADQPDSGLFLISFFVDVNATLASDNGLRNGSADDYK